MLLCVSYILSIEQQNVYFLKRRFNKLIGYGGKTFDLFGDEIEIGEEIVFKE
jgi:hypothetical protein